MSNTKEGKDQGKENRKDRASYEAPAIIYEGLITTRAATSTSNEIDTNPVDIFNTD